MTRQIALVLVLLGIAVITIAADCRSPYMLIYNPSVSAPRGFYLLRPLRRARLGDYVVADLPATTAMLAAARGYLPSTVPVLKHVAAIAGTHACVRDSILLIDHVPAATLRARDGHGLAMPSWRQCRVLRSDELFLLSTDSAVSFDSRYFGPINVRAVHGRATPLWTWNTPSG